MIIRVSLHLLTFFLLLESEVKADAGQSTLERLTKLEKDVQEMKNALNVLEPLMERRYGLIRHCETPEVVHGEALCAAVLKPKARCSLRCNPGYVPTPGKQYTSCKVGGTWSTELQCELPLLIVSGGTVGHDNQGDSSVEAVSLYPSKGCDINLPDMPLAEKTHRSLHNLIYRTDRRELLACNGLTGQKEATCDMLDFSMAQPSWSHHSFPNEYHYDMMDSLYCMTERDRKSNKDRCDNMKKVARDRKKGVYAAQGLHTRNGKVIIAGGMEFDSAGHKPISKVKQLSNGLHKYWPNLNNLNEKRAFFCAVDLESGYLAIGGLSRNNDHNIVTDSVEYKDLSGKKEMENIASMTTPRSGHGCALLPQPGDKYGVLVSGGTKGIGHGESALATTEILNVTSYEWMEVSGMKEHRFGHAVVHVGDKVFAVGGDNKDPSHILDSIEEFDPTTNSWRLMPNRLKKPRANFGFALVPHSLFDGCKIDLN